jgi:hypothetical protein
MAVGPPLGDDVSMRRRSLGWLSLSLVALLTACGDDGGSDSAGAGASSAGGAGGASTGAQGGGGSTGTFGTGGAGGGCDLGAECEGGVCTEGGVCCPSELACGTQCCGAGQACSFGACVDPGIDCVESSDCPDGEYCEQSLGAPVPPPDPMCTGGEPIQSGKCLPSPPVCPDGQLPDPSAPTCVAACEVVPAFPSFDLTLKHAWGGQTTSPFATDVMMTPIVINLDDDDCDGKITERDVPEIVFSTFSGGAYKANGVLHAISIVGGAVVEKWSAPGVIPTMQLAGGEIDGQPGNEVVACTLTGAVRAFDGATGAERWTSAPIGCFMPQLADLDADGDVEVVVEGGILDGATGQLEHAFSAPLNTSFVISDVDGGGLDVVTGNQVFHADGQLALATNVAIQSFAAGTADWKTAWPALADLDGDGKPEIVVVDNFAHALIVWRVDPNAPGGFVLVRAAVDTNGPIPPSACPVGNWGNLHGGGPPTIADFTGDGVPDVATAGGVGYVVFDGADLVNPAVPGPSTIQWIKPTTDCSSASTGSTVFDFNGDGTAEVVYSDQQKLRIYDGPTGDVLFETCNTTATLIENPVVADVDSDGRADVVVVSNAYGSASPSLQCNDGMALGQSGVRVFGSASDAFVRTRRVWNQHAYHVTNVAEDGTIPQNEPANWLATGLNNFRQNKQPGSEFAAPDAVVTLAPRCNGDYALVATVRNLGEAALPPGVPVGFYVGMPPNGTLLGTLATQSTLLPAESEALVLAADPLALGASVYAVVDHEGPPHPQWAECRTDNNTSAVIDPQCDTPQ